MGGSGGRSINPVTPYVMPENPYVKNLNAWAGDLWGTTAPIRSSFANDYFMPFLKGNYKPETLPGFAPLYDIGRTGIEDQYNVAKGNIEANTPRGGAMTNALANLELNRAKSTGTLGSQVSSGLINDLWNKAYNTGWVTAPAQAFAGEGKAADIYNSMGQTNAAANMQAQNMNMQQQMAANAADTQGKASGAGLLGTGIGSLIGLATAPMTGGTSLLGSGMSGLSGMTGGKGGGGVTSGLGGYSSLMANANPMGW